MIARWRSGFEESPPAPPSQAALSSLQISVFVRKRPLLPFEAKAGAFDVVTPSSRDVGPSLVVHEPKTMVDLSKVSLAVTPAVIPSVTLDDGGPLEGVTCRYLYRFNRRWWISRRQWTITRIATVTHAITLAVTLSVMPAVTPAIDLSKAMDNHTYKFDAVFGETASNRRIFESALRPMVRHLFDTRGGHGTCFAYGQTGSGKTVTMEGLGPDSPHPDNVMGMYAYVAAEIFNCVSEGALPALDPTACGSRHSPTPRAVRRCCRCVAAADASLHLMRRCC
jgi:hypothetical protein